MADDNGRDADDAYVIEDTESSVEEIEREMRETAAEAAAEAAPEPESASPQEDYKGRYVRLLADFENFRKRTEREKAGFVRYATTEVLKDVLPVLEDFDRALDHAEEGDDFHKGVLMIYKQLLDVLRKHGLKPIDEEGVAFDPNVHEALMREENDAVPNHTVVAVLRKGYFLHDRLLRPAQVKVAVGGPERA